jgi:hypothetical protein
MTALEDFQAIRTSKYANLMAFIADPEPTSAIPGILARLDAVETWILLKELE